MSSAKDYLRQLHEQAAAAAAQPSRRDTFLEETSAYADSPDPANGIRRLTESLKSTWSGVRATDAPADGDPAGSAPAPDPLVARIRAILASPTAPPEERVAAVRMLHTEVTDEAATLALILPLLAEPATPTPVLLEALSGLHVLLFSSNLAASLRPDLLAALRPLRQHPQEAVREEAIRLLVQLRDDDTFEQLRQDLESHSYALLPPEKSLPLLSFNLHAGYFPLLYEMVRHAPNVATKRAATQLLAADPAAAPLLNELLQDPTEDALVRRYSITALQSVAPAQFEATAKTVARRDDDDPEVRVSCLTALQRLGNPAALQQDTSFNQELRQISRQTTSESLERAVRSYQSALGLE